MKLSTRIRSLFLTLTLGGLVLGLQACGGGGGSDTPAPTDQDPSGIYTSGSITVDPTGINTTHSDFVGMVHNNNFMLFSITGHVLYEGLVTSITLDEYTATVDVYKDGVKVDSGVDVTGTISTESNFTGTLAGGTNNYSTGDFSIDYDVVYKRTPSYARIEGANFVGLGYTTTNINTNYGFRADTQTFVGFSVEADPKCLYFNGVVNLPTGEGNIYEISGSDIIDSLNCPIVSSGYDGMATLMDNTGSTTDDKVFIAITNGINSVFTIATR